MTLGTRSLLKDYRGLARRYPGQVPWLERIRYFLPWAGSLAPGRNPVLDQNIWVVFKAKAFLEATLTPGMKVFEYGMGGSTLYFLRKRCVVFSVEHHPEWYDGVAADIRRLKHHSWRGYLRPPDPLAPYPSLAKNGTGGQGRGREALPSRQAASCTYRSEAGEFQGRTFTEYVKTIEEFPPDSFDLVSIDGRARDSCFVHAHNKVRPGGFLLLDNSERPRYGTVHESLARLPWTRYDFFGPGPYVRHEFWGTTIWQRNG